MSDEESARSIIDLDFSDFAVLFLTIVGTGVGLIAGAYRVFSQDLSSDSAIVLSGITAVVVVGFMLTLYNRITIERMKRREP